MNTTVIVLIILLIVVAAGVAFWYTDKQAKAKAEEEKAAAEAAAAAAEAAAAAVVAPEPAPDTAPTPAGTHPLAGDKFIIVKGEKTGAMLPSGSVQTDGSRTENMVITLEPIDGEADTYFLLAKADEEYLKVGNKVLLGKKKKPTTEKSLKPYKIKMTKVADDYVMSYMDGDDNEMFFGYNGQDITETATVAEILTTGLVNFEDAGVSSFILAGHFGDSDYKEFEIAVDDEDEPIENIQGCLDAFPDAEFGEDVDMDDFLAVAYKKPEQVPNQTDESGNPVMTKPCRAYTNTSARKTIGNATGWVTTCVDNTKDIKQGCLL